MKEEFRGKDNKTMMVVEPKKIKQKSKIIKEFVQEFRRVTRGSRYEGRLFVEKLKRGNKIKTNRIQTFTRSIE